MVPEIIHLPVGAPFAKTVYKQIRPHVPRQFWPQTAVRAAFGVAPDGFSLTARFDDFPAAAAAQAAEWVRRGGIDLLTASPARAPTARMFRALRWRDSCLYALVPLLFAIPLSSLLAEAAMRGAALLFALDAAALLFSHLWLVRRRAQLAALRFSADIPSPGLRLSAAAASLDEAGASL